MSENLIHDVEKAHVMALAGDEYRTKAMLERRRIATIRLAKFAYGNSTDKAERRKILNDVFREVGVNDIWNRPDVLHDRADPAVLNSQNTIDLEIDRQISAFFEPSNDYEIGLDGVAERNEEWAELIYGNPAVEYYKPKYPKINFEERYGVEDPVRRAIDYYQRYVKDGPRYREVIKEGKYVVSGLHDYLFENRYDQDEEDFKPNTELVELLQNNATTIGQLREFILRQETLKEEMAKLEAEGLAHMLEDVKSRQVSPVLEI